MPRSQRIWVSCRTRSPPVWEDNLALNDTGLIADTSQSVRFVLKILHQVVYRFYLFSETYSICVIINVSLNEFSLI